MTMRAINNCADRFRREFNVAAARLAFALQVLGFVHLLAPNLREMLIVFMGPERRDPSSALRPLTRNAKPGVHFRRHSWYRYKYELGQQVYPRALR